MRLCGWGLNLSRELRTNKLNEFNWIQGNPINSRYFHIFCDFNYLKPFNNIKFAVCVYVCVCASDWSVQGLLFIFSLVNMRIKNNIVYTAPPATIHPQACLCRPWADLPPFQECKVCLCCPWNMAHSANTARADGESFQRHLKLRLN